MEQGSDIARDNDMLRFLSLVSSRLIRPYERMFHEDRTTLQLLTLCTLKCLGATPVTELAARLGLSKQQTTKLVKKLCEEGDVSKCHAGSDRRVVLAELTEECSERLSQSKNSFATQLAGTISAAEGEDAAERFVRDIRDLSAILSGIPAADMLSGLSASKSSPSDTKGDIHGENA